MLSGYASKFSSHRWRNDDFCCFRPSEHLDSKPRPKMDDFAVYSRLSIESALTKGKEKQGKKETGDQKSWKPREPCKGLHITGQHDMSRLEPRAGIRVSHQVLAGLWGSSTGRFYSRMQQRCRFRPRKRTPPLRKTCHHKVSPRYLASGSN